MSDKLREIVSNMTAGPWLPCQKTGQISFSTPSVHPSRTVEYFQICDVSSDKYEEDTVGIATLRNNADLLLAVIVAARAQNEHQLQNGGEYSIDLAEQVHVALNALDAKIGET